MCNTSTADERSGLLNLEFLTVRSTSVLHFSLLVKPLRMRSLFMVSACCWRGRLCFGRGRDRGFVLYISLFLRVLGWWVCVCLYTRVHAHELLGYLMWAQVWDGHLESQKNPDLLTRSIHVDRIGVQSAFVYVYAGLRVLMIWANCFFLVTCLFFWEKQKVWQQSANHSLSLRWV